MASRLSFIADTEGVNGKPIAAYVQLVKECNGNMRQALQRIASGEMLD
jgi:hypothetical protein